jgi:hypothetical protein
VLSDGVTPRGAAERDAIREQLGRVLASGYFKNSRHYPALLRYVVEQTLEGGEPHLKERALGIAVFGREPEYDTNADPVVRTSACEVRKRLAQYYSAVGREGEIRIDLPAGSYVPEFRLPEAPAPPAAPPAPVDTPRGRRPSVMALGAAALGLAALAALPAGTTGSQTATERFWNPVFRSNEPVTICVEAPYNPDATRPPAYPTYLVVMTNDRMAFSDALTLGRLTGLLGQFGQRFEVRRGTASTLADFQRGPLLLIGAFNNPWTMRLTSQLRFAFERAEGAPGGVIRDRQGPAKNVWTHHPNLPYSQINDDYAIVSRFVDRRTEKVVVVVAGLGRDGTISAGEFVTEPRHLEALAALAPRGWERKNVQVVLATELVNGNAAPPRIVAAHFW